MQQMEIPDLDHLRFSISMFFFNLTESVLFSLIGNVVFTCSRTQPLYYIGALSANQ